MQLDAKVTQGLVGSLKSVRRDFRNNF